MAAQTAKEAAGAESTPQRSKQEVIERKRTAPVLPGKSQVTGSSNSEAKAVVAIRRATVAAATTAGRLTRVPTEQSEREANGEKILELAPPTDKKATAVQEEAPEAAPAIQKTLVALVEEDVAHVATLIVEEGVVTVVEGTPGEVGRLQPKEAPALEVEATAKTRRISQEGPGQEETPGVQARKKYQESGPEKLTRTLGQGEGPVQEERPGIQAKEGHQESRPGRHTRKPGQEEAPKYQARKKYQEPWPGRNIRSPDQEDTLGTGYQRILAHTRRTAVKGNLRPYMQPTGVFMHQEEMEIQRQGEKQPPEATQETGQEGEQGPVPGNTVRRKSTKPFARALGKIMIERKVDRAIKLTFLPLEHWQTWRDLKDDAWAETVRLGAFYEYTLPVPRTKLVADFVEGFQYTKREKTEYTLPIRATVRGKPVEITVWTIQQALGIEGNRTATAPKANKELDDKYVRQFGLIKSDFNTDGIRIKGFSEEYEDRVKALVEIMCMKKKSHYASMEVLENMYQAVRKGNHNWAPLILSSLRRLLIRVRTSNTRNIKGAELIDAILRSWFPEDEEYVDPDSDQESSGEE